MSTTDAVTFWDGVHAARPAAPRRIATGPGGRTAEVTDHVLLIRRTA
ncbi:hypothetical protein [Actinoallomurus sp. NPDC052274]